MDGAIECFADGFNRRGLDSRPTVLILLWPRESMVKRENGEEVGESWEVRRGKLRYVTSAANHANARATHE